MNLALPLPLPEPAPPPAPSRLPALVPPPSTEPQAKRRRSHIWLALHFPDWPLHAALSGLTAEQRAELVGLPVAVTDLDRQRHVMACNEIAANLGVRAGHSLNAAMVLCPQLNALQRAPAQEHSLLKRTAEHCLRYSSIVSTADPDELLLEIRGSLRLFGGLRSLMSRIRADLLDQSLIHRMTAAPTPESALWLARASAHDVVQPLEMRRALDKLPIAVLRWPPEVELRLWRFGVRTLGELLRLPRAGLTKRIGPKRMIELDRALGRCPSLRRPVLETESFQDTIRLDFEITATALLEPLLQRSLQRLARFLVQRQLTTGSVRIVLRHREEQSTPLKISLARPTSDIGHMCNLLHEKLNSFVVPAPVAEISVTADQLLRAQPTDRSLFAADDRQPQLLAERKARLYEQLAGRLGEHSVCSLRAVADLRPECASQQVPAVGSCKDSSLALPPELPRRPRWLLPQPRPIVKSQLHAKAVLRGPESIDAGWWDQRPAHRDYFVARSRRGSLWWIFRDRARDGQLYLHGLFG